MRRGLGEIQCEGGPGGGLTLLPSIGVQEVRVSAVSLVPARPFFPETCGNGLLARAAAKSNISLAVRYPDRLSLRERRNHVGIRLQPRA